MPQRTVPPLPAEDVIVDHGWRLTAKRTLDIGLSVLLLIPAALMVGLCAVLIRMTSRGPIFYTQTRLGLFGRPFQIWKLRSMTHECERTSGARWSVRKDPRVTPIGRFLRMTHLDELPQLINVLLGDMSLVGPRPERPEFIPILESSIPKYRRRLLVRPGVTGLAQVYLPPDTGIPSVRKKLQYDLHYIQTLGVFLDMRLIVVTALQAMGFPCELAQRVMMLPKPELIERNAERPEVEPLATVAAESRSFESKTETAV